MPVPSGPRQQSHPDSSRGGPFNNARARGVGRDRGVVTRPSNPRGRGTIQPPQDVLPVIRAPDIPPQSTSTLFSNASGVSVEGSCVQSYSGVNFNLNFDLGRKNNVGPEPSPGAGTALHSVQEVEEHIIDSKQSVNDNVMLPPLPIQRSCDIYYRHLAVKGRGSPLWQPDPNWNLPIGYRRIGISIGDVGLITEDGSFDFLFNILLPPDDPVHAGRVPEMFSPLNPPLSLDDVEKREQFGEDSYLASETVEKRQRDGQGRSSGLTFDTTDSEGAILTLPKGSDSSKLLNTRSFNEYLAANVESWYCYTNGPRGREAKNGDLRLVMGWDKAKAWGICTFSRSSKAATSIRLDFKPSEQSGRNYKWEYSGMAEGRTGPSARQIADLRCASDPPDVTFTNQCLFIRTINHLLPDDVWARLEATKFGTIKTEGSAEYSSSSEAEKGKGRATHSAPSPHDFRLIALNQHVDSSSNFTTSLPFHPSASINKRLLRENPEARIAITEDTDWMSVLTEDDDSLPCGDHIVERVMKSHDICKYGDVVSLTPKAHHSSSSSGPQYGFLLDSPITKDSLSTRSASLHFQSPVSSQMGTTSNDVLSWTNQDSRESALFNSWGVVYRFQTTVAHNGQSLTTMWRTLRPNKEDRIAKLEWGPNGGLGRVMLGKQALRMSDLVRPDPAIYNARSFTGPDGLQYRWRPSTISADIMLLNPNGVNIAFFRPTRQKRYQIGDVYGELHFIRTAGLGTVTHQPMMDMVTLTAMLYRFCIQWNL